MTRPLTTIFASLVLSLGVPASGVADPALRNLLVDLNSIPVPVTKSSEDEPSVRITGDSGSFSLLPSKPHSSISSQHWVRREREDSSPSAFDLVLVHQPEGSWIWVHIGSKSRGGMPGVLAAITPYVRSFIVDYDPDEVVSEVSLETYRGSVVYCGRVRDTHQNRSCSLAHVVLHGEKTLRFYAMIVARKEDRRDALLREFTSMLASIELRER